MPKLKNNTDKDITASSGHVIPANGTLPVSPATLERMGQENYTAGLIRRQDLEILPDDTAEDEAPVAEIPTRNKIASSSRSTLLKIAREHNLTLNSEAELDELRRDLVAHFYPEPEEDDS